MAEAHELGRRGEDAVAAWYGHAGFTILERNWRTKGGELDLICCRDRMLVICEVKTRSSARFGSGFEAVTVAKQRRIRRLAAAWLAADERRWPAVRFDVADVDGRGHVKILADCF